MQKIKENQIALSIIFLKECRLEKSTVTLNARKRKKKNWSCAHQYLIFLMKLRYKEILIDCLYRSLGVFESKDNHDIAREIVCDLLQIQRNRYAEFIVIDFDNYIDQLKKLRVLGGELKNFVFSELFEVDIQVYWYETPIVSNNWYIYLMSI